MIELCSAMIRADIRIRRAGRELARAHTRQTSFDLGRLRQVIAAATTNATVKLTAIRESTQAVSIGDAFQMQMLMNHLSTISEMSTAVVSAASASLPLMGRDVKG